MTTRVVNIKREPCDVLIDRRTPYGNRYVVGRDGNRWACIAAHMADWRAALNGPPTIREHTVDRLRELKGKRLGCHCKPEDCHGDNYVKLIAELGL